jgi:mRNA interferase RelE/StbE
MKDFRIQFTPEAAKLIAKLHPDNKKLIKEGIKLLRQNPYVRGDLQEELSDFKSYKLKRYRVIYKIIEEQKTIHIYYVGHRSDVYEQFQILLNKLS